MKILIIRNFPTYMDIKHNTYNIQEVGLAKALVRAGHQCDILFWTDKTEEDTFISVDQKKINVFYRHGSTVLKNVHFNKCEPLINKYDILQTVEYNQFESWYFAKKYPDKVVIYHGPYYSDFNKRYNAMCKVFDLFGPNRYIHQNTTFISKSGLATHFLESKGISNIYTCGVGIDKDMLVTESSDVLEFIKDIDQIKEKKILYIGRIEPRRNPYFLLDVLEKVNNKEPVTLILVGSGEKEYVSSFFEELKKRNLKNRIIYKDKIEQKYMDQLYRRADAFLLPTYYEIFGMVLLEAMYFSKVVITTDNGGSRELIEDGNNGFVINEFNSGKWANKVIEILDNEDLRRQIGELAHKSIEEKHTWDALVPKFLDAYNKR